MNIKLRLYERSNIIKENTDEMVACIERMALDVSKNLSQGNKLMFCGNGGSAAESQHMAAEYCATLDHKRPRPGMAALALTTDTSFLTAWTNDFGYEEVFQRQVETLGVKGDTLFCYSTSGNSKNICLAARSAKRMGIHVLGFTGKNNSKLEKYCDLIFKAPSKNTPVIQELHTILGHEICLLVEKLIKNES